MRLTSGEFRTLVDFLLLPRGKKRKGYQCFFNQEKTSCKRCLALFGKENGGECPDAELSLKEIRKRMGKLLRENL